MLMNHVKHGRMERGDRVVKKFLKTKKYYKICDIKQVQFNTLRENFSNIYLNRKLKKKIVWKRKNLFILNTTLKKNLWNENFWKKKKFFKKYL